MMVAVSDSRDAHFLSQHETPFHDDDLFHDRDDDGVAFFTNCRNFVDRPIDHDMLDFDAFFGQKLVNEVIVRVGDRRHGDVTGFTDPPADLKLLGVKLEGFGIQRMR